MVSHRPYRYRIFVIILTAVFVALFSGCASKTKRVSKAEAPLSSAGQDSININTAGKSELMTLPGVGEKTAQKIIEHRKTYGEFRNPAELMLVEGIGETHYLKLEKMIRTIN